MISFREAVISRLRKYYGFKQNEASFLYKILVDASKEAWKENKKVQVDEVGTFKYNNGLDGKCYIRFEPAKDLSRFLKGFEKDKELEEEKMIKLFLPRRKDDF